MHEARLPEPAEAWEPAAKDRPLDERTAGADAFDRAFARLGADDRALLLLHHLQARPVAEIAAVMGCPEGTIKARLHRARAALESALAREAR